MTFAIKTISLLLLVAVCGASAQLGGLQGTVNGLTTSLLGTLRDLMPNGRGTGSGLMGLNPLSLFGQQQQQMPFGQQYPQMQGWGQMGGQMSPLDQFQAFNPFMQRMQGPNDFMQMRQQYGNSFGRQQMPQQQQLQPQPQQQLPTQQGDLIANPMAQHSMQHH